MIVSAGMFPCFEVFCAVMDQCTENYECIVINNNAKSNRIEDQVFWYKASSHPPFELVVIEFGDIIIEIIQDLKPQIRNMIENGTLEPLKLKQTNLQFVYKSIIRYN